MMIGKHVLLQKILPNEAQEVEPGLKNVEEFEVSKLNENLEENDEDNNEEE